MIIILSGGMDSATLAYLYKDMQITTIFFDYGQRQAIHERIAVQDICNKLNIPESNQKIIHLEPDIFHPIQAFKLKSIIEKTPEVVKGTTYPLRNAIFLSIACSIASQNNQNTIAFGALKSMYADCQPGFVTVLENALSRGLESRPGIHITTPFITWSKTDLVRYGTQNYNVPYEITYSCYDPPDNSTAGIKAKIHCGECAACVERKLAFTKAMINDPTNYFIS